MTKRLDDNQDFINTVLTEANWSQANIQIKLDELTDAEIVNKAGLPTGGKSGTKRGRPRTRNPQGSGDNQAEIAIGNALNPRRTFQEPVAHKVLGLSKSNVPPIGDSPTGGIEPYDALTRQEIDPEAPRLGSDNKLRNRQAAFHSRRAQGRTGPGPDGRSIEPVIGPNADPNLGHDPKILQKAAADRQAAEAGRAGLVAIRHINPEVAAGLGKGTMAVRRQFPDGSYESAEDAAQTAANTTAIRNILTPPQRDLASTDYSLKYDACPLCESQLEDDEVIFENIGPHFNSLLNVLQKVEAINEGEEVEFDDLLNEGHEEGKCPLCESYVEDNETIMANMNEHFDVILEMLEESEEN